MKPTLDSQQKTHLRWLRLGTKAFYWIVLAAAFGLPLLTKGTELHETALMLRNYIGVGLLLGKAYFYWSRLVTWNHVRLRLDVDGPWILPAMLSATVPCTVATYFAYRALKHAGDWSQTLALSWIDAYTALIVNVFVALGSTIVFLVNLRYRRRTGVITGQGAPSPFWQIALLFFVPALLGLLVFAVLWFML